MGNGPSYQHSEFNNSQQRYGSTTDQDNVHGVATCYAETLGSAPVGLRNRILEWLDGVVEPEAEDMQDDHGRVEYANTGDATHSLLNQSDPSSSTGPSTPPPSYNEAVGLDVRSFAPKVTKPATSKTDTASTEDRLYSVRRTTKGHGHPHRCGVIFPDEASTRILRLPSEEMLDYRAVDACMEAGARDDVSAQVVAICPQSSVQSEVESEYINPGVRHRLTDIKKSVHNAFRKRRSYRPAGEEDLPHCWK